MQINVDLILTASKGSKSFVHTMSAPTVLATTVDMRMAPMAIAQRAKAMLAKTKISTNWYMHLEGWVGGEGVK